MTIASQSRSGTSRRVCFSCSSVMNFEEGRLEPQLWAQLLHCPQLDDLRNIHRQQPDGTQTLCIIYPSWLPLYSAGIKRCSSVVHQNLDYLCLTSDDIRLPATSKTTIVFGTAH